MISMRQRGNTNKSEKFLKKVLGRDYLDVLDKFAQEGVSSLAAATPVKTGKTASSWFYEIIQNENGVSIRWNNSNVIKDYANVAVLLQYGHGTRFGGYVQGRDYINPAIKPIMDKMSTVSWKEVTES